MATLVLTKNVIKEIGEYNNRLIFTQKLNIPLVRSTKLRKAKST